MNSYTFLNDDGDVMDSVEADNAEEAKSLCEHSDHYELIKEK